MQFKPVITVVILRAIIHGTWEHARSKRRAHRSKAKRSSQEAGSAWFSIFLRSRSRRFDQAGFAGTGLLGATLDPVMKNRGPGPGG
jgi:hypothetical protein